MSIPKHRKKYSTKSFPLGSQYQNVKVEKRFHTSGKKLHISPDCQNMFLSEQILESFIIILHWCYLRDWQLSFGSNRESKLARLKRSIAQISLDHTLKHCTMQLKRTSTCSLEKSLHRVNRREVATGIHKHILSSGQCAWVFLSS